MFFRSQKAEAASAAVLHERPLPKEIVNLPLEDNELKAYERTAASIEFYPAALLEAKLLKFFKDKDIKIYNYEEVSEYLAKKAKKDGKIWNWSPLRKKDLSYALYRIGEFEKNGWYRSDRHEQYQGPVPLRVLGTVEQIIEKFGHKVQFFVSDYAVPKPDPFIMVMASGMKHGLIFDVWDEPDFKG